MEPHPQPVADHQTPLPEDRELRMEDDNSPSSIFHPRFSGDFEEQRRRLSAHENRLVRDTEALNRERERVSEDYLRQFKHLEKAHEELRQATTDLDAARERFARERARTQSQWREHWAAEWARLTKESAEIAQKSQIVAKQSAEVELQRRQVEASWAELRREQQTWQQRKAHEDARLQERGQTLEEREADLVASREQWEKQRQLDEAAHLSCRHELESLEPRIANYRRKLAGLQQEVAAVEARVCQAAAQPDPHPNPSPTLGRGAGVRGSSTHLPTRVLPRSPTGVGERDGRMLAEIAVVIEEIEDECRRLAEQVKVLTKIRESWQWEWEIAVAELTLRDRELDQRHESVVPRERAVQRSEETLQRRSEELDHWQQHLQCWEARLFKQQSIFRCERRRLLAIVKARVAGTREQQKRVARLRDALSTESRQELQRVLEACERFEQARQESSRAREAAWRRQEELDRRERALVERDLVIAQAEQELVAHDPEPAAAEKELERRRRYWQNLATRPVRSLRRREKRLEDEARQLQRHFEQLVHQQKALQSEKAAWFRAQTELHAKETGLAVERIHWHQELTALRDERAALEQHVYDLQQQVERLALVFVGDNPPASALALAA